MIRDHFRVLLVDLTSGQRAIKDLDGRNRVAGGSGLAALLFEKYGLLDKPWNDPRPAADLRHRAADRVLPADEQDRLRLQVSLP